MTAKEMFHELGFECKKTNCSIKYYKQFIDFYDKSYILDIVFRLIEKKFFSDLDINMPLLKAINKQIEELGWNE